MIAANSMQLTVVTPETTLLSVEAVSLQFPLEDGQIGILPQRAPLVGRLGTGELIVKSETGQTSYFVSGGFVQVKGNAVTLLTNEALELSSLVLSEVESEFEMSLGSTPGTVEEAIVKQKQIERNRKLLAMLKR